MLTRALKIEAKQFGRRWAEERHRIDPTYHAFDARCVSHDDLTGDALGSYQALVAASASRHWRTLR